MGIPSASTVGSDEWNTSEYREVFENREYLCSDTKHAGEESFHNTLSGLLACTGDEDHW